MSRARLGAHILDRANAALYPTFSLQPAIVAARFHRALALGTLETFRHN
jgi:hypothetical protein